MNLVRDELGFSKTTRRLPTKGMCLVSDDEESGRKHVRTLIEEIEFTAIDLGYLAVGGRSH